MKKIRIGVTACGACLLLMTIGCASKTNQATTSTAGGQTSTAPAGDQAAKAKVALVRFVDAIPGRKANLAFGDQELFPDVSYKTATPYKEVPGERHDFKLTTGRETNKSPVTNSEGLTNGARYTVVAALDKNGNEKLDVINDNLSEPSNGKAKLRVINAADADVDVYAPVSMNGNRGSAEPARHPNRTNPYADEDQWFSGVNRATSTDFKDVEPYEGRLNIVETGANNKHQLGPAVHVPLDLKPGEIYTIVVTGGTRAHPLEALKIEDRLNGSPAQAGGSAGRP